MGTTETATLNLDGLARDLDLLRQAASGQSLRLVAEYARAGQQLENLLRHVVVKAWVEADGDEITITWQDREGRFCTTRGLDLPDALQNVGPCQDGKVCKGPCGSWLPLAAYNRNNNNPDGRCYRCRVCEKFRLRKRRRRKRAG